MSVMCRSQCAPEKCACQEKMDGAPRRARTFTRQITSLLLVHLSYRCKTGRGRTI